MPFIEAEFASGIPTDGTKPISRKAFHTILQQVRQTNLSWIQGDLVRGVDGLSAPVFDHEGHIVMALTIMGMHGPLDLTSEGQTAKILLRVAEDLSRRIGFAGDSVSVDAATPQTKR